MNRLNLLVLSAALVPVGGCVASDTEATTEEPKVAFEGAPESRFAATWKTDNGNSTYSLKEDGTYHLKAKIQVRDNSFDSESDGEWKVNKDRLLFKDQFGNVTPYAYTLEGSKLTLTLTGSMKNQTVLIKQ